MLKLYPDKLYPEPVGDADTESVYGDLELPVGDTGGLPYVILNMVCSVDGRSSVAGRASGIGSRVDRAAMRDLRARVDAVMIGAGTLRAEKVNLGLDDPRSGQPLAVLVGGAGEIPLAENLVLPAGQNAVLALPPGTSSTQGDADQGRVTEVRCPGSETGRVRLPWLLRTLRAEYAVERLLVEGGPGLNRALIDRDLVDEVFVTIAPKLLLGKESAILSGARDESHGEGSRNLTLVSVRSAGGELFLRYRLVATA